MNFLNKFNFKLILEENLNNCKDNDFENIQNNYICNIDAKFGKQVTELERFDKAIKHFNIDSKSGSYKVMQKHKNVFMAHQWDIGCTNIMKHRILTNGGPINIKPRRQPINLEDKIDEAIRNLERNGIIRKCNSPWNTPMVCVWKKEKKDIRLCLDFRQLNKITERPAFPMPHIDEMLDILNGSRYFSTIDLSNAYYQVKLDEESQEKTAFSTKTGQFCFNRMPFGIAAAPATSEKLMTDRKSTRLNSSHSG